VFAEWRIVSHMVNQRSALLVDEEWLDVVFGALADRSRRSVVRRLAEAGELPVGDAAADLDLSPAGVSKHVKVLESAGLVRRRVDGRQHLLSLESEPLLLAEDWIDRYHQLWSTSMDRLAALAAELEDDDV
jgi:DNA-binding transcriptional ArsR family regulator